MLLLGMGSCDGAGGASIGILHVQSQHRALGSQAVLHVVGNGWRFGRCVTCVMLTAGGTSFPATPAETLAPGGGTSSLPAGTTLEGAQRSQPQLQHVPPTLLPAQTPRLLHSQAALQAAMAGSAAATAHPVPAPPCGPAFASPAQHALSAAGAAGLGQGARDAGPGEGGTAAALPAFGDPWQQGAGQVYAALQEAAEARSVAAQPAFAAQQQAARSAAGQPAFEARPDTAEGAKGLDSASQPAR